jgi:hypothetical protein
MDVLKTTQHLYRRAACRRTSRCPARCPPRAPPPGCAGSCPGASRTYRFRAVQKMLLVYLLVLEGSELFETEPSRTAGPRPRAPPRAPSSPQSSPGAPAYYNRSPRISYRVDVFFFLTALSSPHSSRRARPRCRSALPRIRFVPDSLTYSVPPFLKRQCGRALLSPARPQAGSWTKRLIFSRLYGGCMVALKMSLNTTAPERVRERVDVGKVDLAEHSGWLVRGYS